MKKFIFLVVICLIAQSCLLAEEPVFRDVEWGMTLKEVMDSEGICPIEQKANQLVYKTDINGREGYLIYDFLVEKLGRVSYFIHTDIYSCINEHQRYRSLLIEKYGNFSRESENWKIDKPKNVLFPSLNIACGEVEYVTEWKLKKMDIMLWATSYRKSPVIKIEYRSKNWNDSAFKGGSKDEQSKD